MTSTAEDDQGTLSWLLARAWVFGAFIQFSQANALDVEGNLQNHLTQSFANTKE